MFTYRDPDRIPLNASATFFVLETSLPRHAEKMPPKQKINGIAFHGSGGLLWYYMGIAQFIQDNYDTSELQFCGVSGGCLPGVFLSSQLSIKQIRCIFKQIRLFVPNGP